MAIKLQGQTFGKLTVLSESEPAIYPQGRRRRWLCRCRCGQLVTRNQSWLVNPLVEAACNRCSNRLNKGRVIQREMDEAQKENASRLFPFMKRVIVAHQKRNRGREDDIESIADEAIVVAAMRFDQCRYESLESYFVAVLKKMLLKHFYGTMNKSHPNGGDMGLELGKQPDIDGRLDFDTLLQSASESQREVIRAIYEEGHSKESVASRTGLSYSAVRHRHDKGLEAIRSSCSNG